MQNVEEATTEVASTPHSRGLASQARRTGREVLDGTERAAKSGLRFVKARARRRDPVGQATYRALELISGGLEATSKALGQLSEATQPPARAVGSRPTATSTSEKKGTARTRPAAHETA
jgi:hypothetical protein